MLGDNNLRHTMQVATIIILIDMIILRTVYEKHHIGILLDGSWLTQVTQLRTLTFQSLTTFHTTIELWQCQNRNVEFLSQTLQWTGDRRYFLLTGRETHAIGIHQLQIVNHDHLHTMLTHQPTCFRTQFKNREAWCVIHIERCIQQLVYTFV